MSSTPGQSGPFSRLMNPGHSSRSRRAFSKRKFTFYRLVWLKHDLPAGISVFLVALPLCLGIALASGAPIYSGLLSGIIGGIVVSILSGSPLAVSGPAAGLTSLVAATISETGSFQLFLLSVIVAGLFQLLLGILKWGSIANYFPSSVIKGMLAAIGIILISKQVPIALGYAKPDFWRAGLSHVVSSTEGFQAKYSALDQSTSRRSILIATVSLAVLLVLRHPKAKKFRLLPAPLLAVVAGVLVNLLFQKFFPATGIRSAKLVEIPRNIFASLTSPDFSKLFHGGNIWKDGLFIGLLATLETLLCIEAIDKLDKHNRVTPVNRELIAQGIGNITCGLLGAIPITAVVVRGSANIDAGARTKLSAFTHGVLLLLAVISIPFLLDMIPLASLAAVLVMTGFGLTRPALYRDQWKLGWTQFAPFIITIGVILATDLLVGVSIGLLISIYFIIRNNFKIEYKVTMQMKDGHAFYYIRLGTSVNFLNKVNLRKALDKIPPESELIIDGSDSHFIDHDILEVISEYEHKARDRHIRVQLLNIGRVAIVASH